MKSIAMIKYPCSSNATCGCSLNSAVITKIVGGEQAGSDTWGWAVSIRTGNNHICGGSLISSTLVLTAAHCLISIKSKSTLGVNIGSKTLSTIHQQRSISDVYIHRDYNTNNFLNDIAIVRLSSSIDTNDQSIAVICLPSIENSEYPPIGANVVAIGWGVLASEDKIPSNILQQVTLQVISNTQINCQKTVYNDSSQFCAGVRGGGKDTCQGDSGGPLMLFSDGQWILVGITSYGAGCALADHPGVYTRISYFNDWISCFLSDNNNASCITNAVYKQSIFISGGLSSFYNNILLIFLHFVILNVGFVRSR